MFNQNQEAINKAYRQEQEARAARARMAKEAKAEQSSVNIVETVSQFVQGFAKKQAKRTESVSQEMPRVKFS